jgi:hypothetical protein
MATARVGWCQMDESCDELIHRYGESEGIRQKRLGNVWCLEGVAVDKEGDGRVAEFF